MRYASSARVQSRHGLLLIMLAAVLWGTVGVTTRALYSLSATTPLSIGFFRLALATPVLLPATWLLLGPKALHVYRRDLAVIGLLGVMLAAYQVCYFAAIARVGVSVAVLVTLCTAPVMVAVMSVGLHGERLTRAVLLALGCAIVGTALLVDVRLDGVTGAAPLLGIALALGSAFGYAVITLAGRAVAGRYHPLQVTTIGFAVGALVLLPAALATGFVVSYPPLGWALLVYLGVVPSALAYIVFLSGMRTTPATVASVVTLLEPLTGVVLARVLFGETLGPLGIVGAALLLAALGLLYRGVR